MKDRNKIQDRIDELLKQNKEIEYLLWEQRLKPDKKQIELYLSLIKSRDISISELEWVLK